MASFAVSRRGGGRRSQAAGLEGRRPYLPPQSEPAAAANQDEFIEVHIRWQKVLEEAVRFLGGTELAYSSEVTGDGMFRQYVSFILPADMGGADHETIDVAGNTCFSACEAQSEVVAAALQCLVNKSLITPVLDVSYFQCEEMEEKLEQLVIKSGDFQRGLEMVLSDWSDCTRQTEETIRPFLNLIEEDLFHATNDKVRGAKLKVARYFETALRRSPEQLALAQHEAAVARTRQWAVRASPRNVLRNQTISRNRACQRMLSRELRISMRLVLAEMMISLGWSEPHFITTWGGAQSPRLCRSEVWLKVSNEAADSESTPIQGGHETFEEEAMESAAKAAVLYLEKAKSIYLIDLNYNKRSSVEAPVKEAENVRDLISSLAESGLATWGEGVDEVGLCDDYCKKTVAQHVPINSCNRDYHFKLGCAEASAKLYQACLVDLRASRRRFKSLCAPTDKE